MNRSDGESNMRPNLKNPGNTELQIGRGRYTWAKLGEVGNMKPCNLTRKGGGFHFLYGDLHGFKMSLVSPC